MATLTISDLDDEVTRRLHRRAAARGRSVEDEASDILSRAVEVSPPRVNLAASIRARVAALGGADLDIPLREPMRDPPRLD